MNSVSQVFRVTLQTGLHYVQGSYEGSQSVSPGASTLIIRT